MTTIWVGLAVGAIYVLTAEVLTLPFLVSGVFNFAQPTVLTLAIFIAHWSTAEHHFPIPVVIVLTALVCLLVGAIIERVAVRPLAGRQSHNALVTTLGASVIIEGYIFRVWGTNPYRVNFLTSTKTVDVLGGRVLPLELTLIALAIGVAYAIHFVLNRTVIGLACLAAAEDREAAQLRGIDVKRLSTGVFGVAGALCGALGVVVGAKTFAVYDLGSSLMVLAFVAMAIGGFGSVFGALLGGLTIGLVEQFALRYIGPTWADLVVFFLLLAVLLVRPTGVFGRSLQRVV